MGTVSPLSLEQLCLNCICANIEHLYNEVDEVWLSESSFKKYAFKFPVLLHEQLADSIIRNLACSKKLNSKTATLFIDPSVCRIRKLCIKNADVDEAILKLILSNHKISEVDLSGASMVISTSVFALLGRTSSNLRTLNLSNAIHILDFSALWPLTSLTHLDISNSAVDDTDLSLISQHLIYLQTVNISNTKVIKCGSFGDLKDKLKVLLAYNSQVAWANPTDFKDFVSLQKLDISRNPESMSGYDWPMHAERLEVMLQDSQTMKDLVYLDVSGSPRTLGKSLQVFLSSHPHLKFLGLCKTGRTCYSEFIPSELKVTGEANEKQIIASLEMYPDRAAYMTDVLRRLFAISNNKRIEETAGVLQLVLPPMEKHSRDSRVQMAATACVFNLIRGSREGEVHCSLLRKIASMVFQTMSTFREKNEITRNCLLILESRHMLNNVAYDYFEGLCLAMDSLCYFLSDENIKKVATKLCASLSSRISTTETLALGTERNISTLLKIVQEKVSSNQVDFTLSMTLRTLWNLTDEAPSTSLTFVAKGGLKAAIQGLKVLREHPEEPTYVIVKKILGMLNNVAEVESLRHCLITEEFMAILGSLLEDHSIELTYFSGGILSNVVLSWPDNQTLNTYSKEQMLLKLENAVKGWNFPLEALVAYRSFSSFSQLLGSDMPAVKMWSLWGMLHVCSVNASRYVPLVINDGAIDIIQHLAVSSPVEEVKDLAHKLVVAVRNFQGSVKRIRQQ